MSENRTGALHLKEFKDSTPENPKDDRKISTESTSDPNTTLENIEPNENRVEEKINENETNADVESETESDGIDSIVENGTSEENIRDDLDCNSRHKNSNTDNTSKESDNINEGSISKETVNITETTHKDAGTSTAEDSINKLKENKNLNDGINRREIAEERENKLNENKYLKNGISGSEIDEKRYSKQNENRDFNNGINPRKIPDDDDDDDIAEVKKVLKNVGRFALKTAILSGAILGGTALIVPAIGFGSLGVTGGSLAALYQSSVLGGTIASGSAFATLQSIGMAGLSAATNGMVVAGSAAASAAHTFGKNKEK